jgi:hypothetical protein
MKHVFSKGALTLISFLFLFTDLKAQSVYSATQMDLIFSMAQMNTTAISTKPVPRFSGFLNHETQVHFDFGKSVGIYTGLGIKNIGMINHIDSFNINLKQRTYALGLPLALKLGSMKNQAYVAFGGEINLMTHYKEKMMVGNTKIKSGEWFSNKVNILNPAVFFQIKFLKSQVVTFKYFLNDFLRYQPASLTLPDGTVVNDYGRSSKLFYISWGINLASKDPETKKKLKKQQELKSAKLEE